jgi:hypothetical protein
MADKNFIKDNFALIIALSLPAILVLGFLLASYLPQSFNTPPQYELVFSTSRYDNSLPFHVDFTIINQKLHMRLTPSPQRTGRHLCQRIIRLQRSKRECAQNSLSAARTVKQSPL